MLVVLCFWATVLAAYFAYAKKHYLLSFFMLVYAGYELFGPSLVIASYEMRWDLLSSIVPDHILKALALQFVTASEILSVLGATFLAALIGTYLGWIKMAKARWQSTETRVGTEYILRCAKGVDAFVFLFVVFFCGTLAVYYGDGERLAADYGANVSNALEVYQRAQGAEISKAFGLGINLLPYGYVILVLAFLQKRNLKFLTATCVMLLPMMLELVQAGRRQYFITAAAIIFVIVFYLNPIKNRGVILFGVVVGSAALASFVFYGRADYYADVYDAGNVVSAIVIPAVSELSGISWITSHTINLVTSRDYDFGFRILAGVMDSLIPYVRAGEGLSNVLRDEVRRVDSTDLSPWGAFPMLAEAYSSYGLYGGAVFGILTGSICAALHLGLRRAAHRRSQFHVLLWLVTVAALFLVKYRSGILDFAKAVIALTYLHIFVLVVGGGIARVVKVACSSRTWNREDHGTTLQRALLDRKGDDRT